MSAVFPETRLLSNSFCKVPDVFAQENLQVFVLLTSTALSFLPILGLALLQFFTGSMFNYFHNYREEHAQILSVQFNEFSKCLWLYHPTPYQDTEHCHQPRKIPDTHFWLTPAPFKGSCHSAFCLYGLV